MAVAHRRRRRRTGALSRPVRRRDGRYAARLYVPTDDGRGWSRRDFYGRTATEAEDKREAAAQLLAETQGLSDPFAPLRTVADRWLTACEPPNPTHHAPRGLARSTWIGYEAHVRLHITPFLGEHPVSQLRLDHVARWQSQLQAAGMSGSMRRKVLQTLRTLFAWAKDHDYVADNVARRQPMAAGEKQTWQPLGHGELTAMLAAIEGHYLYAHFLLALVMGPRLGEINGLGLEDFDVEARTLSINHTLTWSTGERGVAARKEVKTARSRRTIYLPTIVFEAIQRHLEQRRQWASDLGWQEFGLLFTRHNGRPLRGDGTGGVGDMFKRCLRRAGLPERNFHQLRHHAATMLLALNGNSYHEVALILGHSTFKLTLDLYGHLIPEVQRERAAQLDAFYEPRIVQADTRQLTLFAAS